MQLSDTVHALPKFTQDIESQFSQSNLLSSQTDRSAISALNMGNLKTGPLFSADWKKVGPLRFPLKELFWAEAPGLYLVNFPISQPTKPTIIVSLQMKKYFFKINNSQSLPHCIH